MYRTLSSTTFLLLILMAVMEFGGGLEAVKSTLKYTLIPILFILFTLSFRKQTTYITSRVKKANMTDDKGTSIDDKN